MATVERHAPGRARLIIARPPSKGVESWLWRLVALILVVSTVVLVAAIPASAGLSLISLVLVWALTLTIALLAEAVLRLAPTGSQPMLLVCLPTPLAGWVAAPALGTLLNEVTADRLALPWNRCSAPSS